MKKRKPNNTENWSHKNDFPIEEVWNTNNTLSQLIAPRLLTFKAIDKHGYPPDFDDMHKWNNAIQKMAEAFELMKYAGATHTEDEDGKIEEGLDLFRNYFRYLWD